MNKLNIWLCLLVWLQPIEFKSQDMELERRDEYLSAVKSLQQFDNEITVSDSIICVPDLRGNFMSKIVAELLRRKYKIAYYYNPVSKAVSMMNVITSVDPQISPSTSDKLIPRYCLEVDSAGTKIFLQDYMAAKSNYWSHTVYDYFDSLSTSRLVDSLVSVLQTKPIQVDLTSVDYEKLWYKVASSNESQDIYTLLALNYLTEAGWKISLTYGKYGFVSNPSIINLNPSKLMGLGKLRIDQVMDVEFSTSVDTTTKLALLLFDSTSYYRRDKFDNLVIGQISYIDKKTIIYIRYVPPLPLNGNDSGQVYLSFDLASLGTDLFLNDWIISPAIPYVYHSYILPYRVFSTPGAIAKCDTQSIQQFLYGIADIESAFGFSRSSIIKDVYITNEWEYNAAFTWSDTDAVIAYCKILSPEAKRDGVNARLVGRHEALHCLAYYYELDDDKNLDALYNSLNSELKSRTIFRWGLVSRTGFLSDISEEKFDALDSTTSGSGGHAYTSTSEFVASFLSSVLRENWQTILAGKKIEFINTYAKCLQIFKSRMRNAKLENTNIYKLIEEKIEWIRNNQ